MNLKIIELQNHIKLAKKQKNHRKFKKIIKKYPQLYSKRYLILDKQNLSIHQNQYFVTSNLKKLIKKII